MMSLSEESLPSFIAPDVPAFVPKRVLAVCRPLGDVLRQSTDFFVALVGTGLHGDHPFLRLITIGKMDEYRNKIIEQAPSVYRYVGPSPVRIWLDSTAVAVPSKPVPGLASASLVEMAVAPAVASIAEAKAALYEIWKNKNVRHDRLSAGVIYNRQNVCMGWIDLPDIVRRARLAELLHDFNPHDDAFRMLQSGVETGQEPTADEVTEGQQIVPRRGDPLGPMMREEDAHFIETVTQSYVDPEIELFVPEPEVKQP